MKILFAAGLRRAPRGRACDCRLCRGAFERHPAFGLFVRAARLRVGRPPRSASSGVALGDGDDRLFDPTMRAVIEQLYQSERPWLVGSSKFERAFGSGAKPQQQAVPATVARFRDYVGR
jgi:hypothetical protein